MLPFDRYEGNGRKWLGLIGQGNCRHNYGLAVFKQCGPRCAYCDRDLSESYESWLNTSIDHVIPRSVTWYLKHNDWIEDVANIVICCRACNEFMNRFPFNEESPADEQNFFDMRDRYFLEKKLHAIRRHNEEQAFYEKWLAKSGNGIGGLDCSLSE